MKQRRKGLERVGGGLGGVFHAMGGDQGISEEVHKVKGKVGGEFVAEGTPVNSRETRCFKQGFRASGEVKAAWDDGVGGIDGKDQQASAMRTRAVSMRRACGTVTDGRGREVLQEVVEVRGEAVVEG